MFDDWSELALRRLSISQRNVVLCVISLVVPGLAEGLWWFVFMLWLNIHVLIVHDFKIGRDMCICSHDLLHPRREYFGLDVRASLAILAVAFVLNFNLATLKVVSCAQLSICLLE